MLPMPPTGRPPRAEWKGVGETAGERMRAVKIRHPAVALQAIRDLRAALRVELIPGAAFPGSYGGEVVNGAGEAIVCARGEAMTKALPDAELQPIVVSVGRIGDHPNAADAGIPAGCSDRMKIPPVLEDRRGRI